MNSAQPSRRRIGWFNASVAQAGGLALAFIGPVTIAAGGDAGNQLFRQRIQPIFHQHCYRCHSHESEKIKGGLVLDSGPGIRAGGDRGPVIEPGRPETSRLLQAVRREDAKFQMPPEGPPLAAEEIEALTQWIRAGAVGVENFEADGRPLEGAMKARPRGPITDQDRRWWSFQPLSTPPLPPDHSHGWARTPIDRFTIETMRREGLTPAPPASPRSFIRRLTFDLTGLPPSPEEIDSFIHDCAHGSDANRIGAADPLPSVAVEQLVDRLLASPQYGERWARPWLDLVRYAESDGYRVDDYRPNVWRYRDWVVKALNDDLPYDRFVQAQLAGDELWPEDPQLARVATAFLRHGIYEYNNRDVHGQWQTMLNELTDTTADVFLGLGLQCAKCHDHKFDPLLQRDYFRLQAFFAPLQLRQDLAVATQSEQAAYATQLAEWTQATAELRAEQTKLEATYRQRAEEDALSKFPPDVQTLLRKPLVERSPYEQQIASLAYRQVTYAFDHLAGQLKAADKTALESIQHRLREYETLKPEPLPIAFTVSDIGPLAPPTFIPRGKAPEPVLPGFPTVFEVGPAKIDSALAPTNSTGRRATLARWLTSPNNPLTARVMVNRVWQQHFGRGLVATSSDFGHLGERPTHPELLDWLASQWVVDGWSLKKLHRRIVTSATYAQAANNPEPTAGSTEPGSRSTTSSAKLPADPENRWLARFPTRRLEAEQIRDAQLAVTGELKPDAGGPSVSATQPRRTLYTRVTRNTRDPLLDAFDAPENFTSTAQRNVTTTPTQALLLLNGPYLLQRARAFAQRIAKDCSGGDDPQRIDRAYRLAFGRSPTTEEQQRALRFLSHQILRIPSEERKFAPFISEKMPYREGHAAVLSLQATPAHFTVPNNPSLPTRSFTIELYALLRTKPDRGGFRVLAAQWDGDLQRPGWALAVADAGPGTPGPIVELRINDGTTTNVAVYASGVPLELNKPYFFAAAVQDQTTGPSVVTLVVKDVSNDCEPMQVIRAPRQGALVGAGAERAKTDFTIGALAPRSRSKSGSDFLHETTAAVTPSSRWDGLIDDVRLSNAPLPVEQLLVTRDTLPTGCVGWWRFEPIPGTLKDHSPQGNDLQIPIPKVLDGLDARNQALADFCQVLLNTNEFFYLD